MPFKNPHLYANKFREELQADLRLLPELSCPKCVITYVDGEQEGCCYYTRTGALECAFDFEEPIAMKEVVQEWIDAVLKAFRHERELMTKWTLCFKQNPYQDL
jgi:hypothetical protein